MSLIDRMEQILRDLTDDDLLTLFTAISADEEIPHIPPTEPVLRVT